jgi:ABC-type transport system involved in multi-copper enzyme maturation permease subunit
MTWLLWKDYRHNRMIVLTGLLVLLLPYVGSLCLIPFRPDIPKASFEKTCQVILVSLASASLFSLVMSQVTVALIGGNAIAGERIDRSAEFLRSLPITRRKILASKLLFALIIVAVIWSNVLLGLCLSNTLYNSREFPDMLHFARFLANVAVTGLLFFCVAWFFSSFLASPTFAVFGGLITPLLIPSGILLVAYQFELPLNETLFQNWNWGIGVSLALAFFAAGTCYYLRRVEP